MPDTVHKLQILASQSRLAALTDTALLDTPPEEYFDRVTRLVCKLVGADTALLSLVTDQRQFFKSSCGLTGPAAEARETPLSHSFCKYVVMSDQPFAVSDARGEPALSDSGAVSELGVVAYLGVPVHAPNGATIGALCALNGSPRAWTAEDIAAIADLAALVDEDLRLRDRARKSDRLADENAVLAREYHHRVKNALSVSAALVKLSARGATSIGELVESASDRLLALADAHNQLIGDADAVDLKDLSLRLLLPYCAPGSAADVDGPSVKLTNNQITPICYFLHELATNSAKYGAFKNHGRASLRWTLSDGTVEMDWNEQLTDNAQRSPQGFGGRLIATAAQQLSGTTTTTWSEDGLNVSLDFPLASR